MPEGHLFYTDHVEDRTPLATLLGPVAVALGPGATPLTNSSGGGNGAAAGGGGEGGEQPGLLGTFTCTCRYDLKTMTLSALTLTPAGQGP